MYSHDMWYKIHFYEQLCISDSTAFIMFQSSRTRLIYLSYYYVVYIFLQIIANFNLIKSL